VVIRDCKEITNHFDSFFFSFSSLKLSTIATAMHDNFALIKKKINSPILTTYFFTIPKTRERDNNRLKIFLLIYFYNNCLNIFLYPLPFTISIKLFGKTLSNETLSPPGQVTTNESILFCCPNPNVTGNSDCAR